MPPRDAQSVPAPRTSLRTSLFFQSFGLLTIAILASTAGAFALSWSELKGRSLTEISSLAEGKGSLFEAELARQRENLSLLGRSFANGDFSSVTSNDGFISLIHFPLSGEPEMLAGVTSVDEIVSELPNNFRTQQQTRFVPIVRDTSWERYLIVTPFTRDAKADGVLVAVYDTRPLASSVTNVQSVGETAEVLFVIKRDGQPLVLRGAAGSGGADFVIASRYAGNDQFVLASLAGDTGIAEGNDYAGIPVVVAYRPMNSVGWAILVKVDRYEFMRPLLRLAMNIVGIGLMLVVLLSLSTFFMSRRIVSPLIALAEKLHALDPKTWQYAQTIHTGNELEFVDATAVDLTARLRTAYDHLEDLVRERTKDLHKELAEKAAILASVVDGLVVTDADGVVTYMNQAAAKLTGHPTEDAVGMHAHEAIVLVDSHGELLAHEVHPISLVMDGKSSYAPTVDPQLTLRRNEKSHIAVNVLAAPILQDGTCTGAVLTMRDMSDARRIDILKSEFISLVSHQLRTPLSTMRWYLELFEDDRPQMTADQAESVMQIGLANTRMNNLVNALLNASRIELGKFQITPTTINIAHILNITAQSLDLQCTKKDIRIERVGIEDLGELKTDANLFALIIDNLLSNAVKYSPEHSVVTVRAEIDTDKGQLNLSFADQGIGIPIEEQKRIGQKLFRGTNAHMSEADGNGLGLYISKLAAEAIGANITFDSTEGKGTTFILRMPLTWMAEASKTS